MKILAVETSTKNLSLAIVDEDSILAEYKGKTELKHSQDLIPNIDSLLKKIDSNLQDINAFAISIGPGSFTGLRVGVSVLKGLNLVTHIPIITVPTLDVIAYNAIEIGTATIFAEEKEDKNSRCPYFSCVIVDAKKKNLYSSLFRVENGGIIRLWDYLLISADELARRVQEPETRNQIAGKDILFLGDGVPIYGGFIQERLPNAKLADKEFWSPDAKIVARLARDKYRSKEFEDPDTLVPMYIYSNRCSIRGIDR